jgi:hypothetical protein
VRHFGAPLALCILTLRLQAQDKVGPPAPSLKFLPTANDALALAAADCKAQHSAARPYLRYVWVTDGEVEHAKVNSLAVNTVGRGTDIIRPMPLGRDRLLVLRLNLRSYAPRAADLKEWLTTWEDFQYDPALNLLVTKGTLRIAQLAFPNAKGRGHVAGWEEQEVPPYQHTDGHTYRRKKVRVLRVKDFALADLKAEDVDVLRMPSPELDPLAYGELAEMTASAAPLVTDAYFAHRALRTIKDKGLYATIYGGRYYELAGVPLAGAKGTDEDALFESLGIGNVEQGITAAKIFEKLRSDQRAAVFRSRVTGSPRRGDFLRHLGVQPGVAQGLISVTHDLKSQSIDIDTHPIANLLDFKDDAREVIWERANGLHGYSLYDGKGKRQDEVPPDVARDHTIPSPHHARLEGAVSCMACHEAEGSDGWKVFPNDVKTLLARGGKLDIFGDLKGGGFVESVSRVAGLYKGEPEGVLVKARDDYARAVLLATGPWKESKAGQTDVVKFAASKLVNRARGHWYDMVDARQALLELGVWIPPPSAVVGVKLPGGDGADLFSRLVPPDKRLAVVVAETGETIIPRDPREAALTAGLSISRADWDLTRAFAAERAAPHIAKLRQGKEKK